ALRAASCCCFTAAANAFFCCAGVIDCCLATSFGSVAGFAFGSVDVDAAGAAPVAPAAGAVPPGLSRSSGFLSISVVLVPGCEMLTSLTPSATDVVTGTLDGTVGRKP